jgi:outer membrane protein assembly factor BamB
VNANPQPVWRTDLGRGIVGGPALAEDVLAVSQVDRQVALLDRTTGDVIWRRRLPANLGTGPLLDDDRVFVATQSGAGRVYALRLTNGRPFWSAGAGDVVAPLALDQGVVFSASVEGWVNAFRAQTGERLWRVRLPGAVRAAPLPVPGGLVVATATDSIFRLEESTGRVAARRALAGAVLAAPALVDSIILVGTTRGRLEALEAATLASRWSLDLGGGVVGSVAAGPRAAHALTAAGTLWTVPLDAPGPARPLELRVVARAGPAPVAEGVFVCAVNGEVALVDSQGRRQWSVRLSAPVSEPVIVEGRMILVVSERGEVVAFR